jgi:hypothetical protein
LGLVFHGVALREPGAAGLPGLPISAESGYPQLTLASWFGLSGPKVPSLHIHGAWQSTTTARTRKPAGIAAA